MNSKNCIHNKRKTYCKECGGSAICEHNIVKYVCKECNGSQLCEHGRYKSVCVRCHGSTICQHNRSKYRCKECNGSEICTHGKRKSLCKECGGSAYCKHDKQKTRCKECGGTHLCKSPLCETRAQNIKYEGYCLNCFIHLFPDKPNSRNYKTKEKAVVDHVLNYFSKEQYSWVKDRTINDGCSKKRPDLLLDLGYQIIIIEIDENQHESYDCSCENKRLMELSKDVGHRPIIFIRFNPDGYFDKEEKITSCWGINKMGICVIKKTKEKEWLKRLNILCDNIKYWCDSMNKTDKTLEIIQLFYDNN